MALEDQSVLNLIKLFTIPIGTCPPIIDKKELLKYFEIATDFQMRQHLLKPIGELSGDTFQI